MANVTVSLSAQDAGLVAKWMAAKQSVASFEQQVRSAGAKGKQAGKETAAGFSTAAAKIGSAVQNLLGLGSATAAAMTTLNLMRQQFEAIAEAQERAARTQVGAADAERALLFAARTGPGELSAEQIVRRTRASTFGVDLSDAFRETEAALSARGQLSQQSALTTAEKARELRPDLIMEDRKALVQASIALQKAFGESPEQSIARVLDILPAARTTDVGALAKTIVPAIAQAASFGGGRKEDIREIASIVIGLGQRAEDPEGRRTATSFIRFLQQIKVALSQEGLISQDATVAEQLKVIQTDPRARKVRDELLGALASESGSSVDQLREQVGKPKLSGEARNFVAMLELLEGSSETMKSVSAAYDQLAGDASTAVDRMKALVRDIESLDTQQAAQRRRRARVEEQQRQSSNLIGGQVAEETRRFEEQLADLGVFDPMKVRSFLFRVDAEQLFKNLEGEQLEEKLEETRRVLTPARVAAAAQRGEGSMANIMNFTNPGTEFFSTLFAELADSLKQNTQATREAARAKADSTKEPDPIPRPAGAKALSD